MIKLMGHLANFASFSKQGEFLCTQSLFYLLKDADAKTVFSSFLEGVIGSSISRKLLWRTEHRQSDGCRPDIEGYHENGISVIKIEAKLDAKFGKRQLKSYMSELLIQNIPCCLIALIPQNRRKEAIDYISSQFSFQGEGPWQVQNTSVAVITWEEVFQIFETVKNQEFSADLVQLCSLYRVLNGDDMEPLTTDEEVLLWREKERWWEKLIDLTTRKLTSPVEKILPMSTEKTAEPYCRRYICRNINEVESCYSVGTRDPFQNYRTPIWLRFHKRTGYFAEISEQLIQSSYGLKVVRSGKHIWYPLEVPQNASREVMINSLVMQVKDIISVAYRFHA